MDSDSIQIPTVHFTQVFNDRPVLSSDSTMKTTIFFVCLIISVCAASSIPNNATHHSADVDVQHHHEGHHGVSLASWRWNLYSEYIVVCLTIVIAGALKLLFHHTHILSKNVPESVRLLIHILFLHIWGKFRKKWHFNGLIIYLGPIIITE